MKIFLNVPAACLLVVVGCASHIAYVPNCVFEESEAQLVVRRFLEEQPAKYAPIKIEITDEKISLTKYRTKGGDMYGRGSEVLAVSTLYRDNIGSTELVLRHQWHMHHWYVARIYDKSGSLFARGITRDKERAQQFLDAIVSLRVPPQLGRSSP